MPGLTPPLQPMFAEARTELPHVTALPGGLAYERKLDGHRAILLVGRNGVYLQSRNGAQLTEAFPDIAEPARACRRWFWTASWLSHGMNAWTSASCRLALAAVVPARGRWLAPAPSTSSSSMFWRPPTARCSTSRTPSAARYWRTCSPTACWRRRSFSAPPRQTGRLPRTGWTRRGARWALRASS